MATKLKEEERYVDDLAGNQQHVTQENPKKIVKHQLSWRTTMHVL